MIGENSIEQFSHLKLAIVGLGYVGLPLAVAFSEKFPVVGFDICLQRINELLQQRDGNIHGATLQFINRLSDWLFVLVRIVAKTQGQAEVLWQKNTLSND